METQENIKDLSTLDAIADAVMFAYAQGPKRRDYRLFSTSVNKDNSEYLFESTTANMCAVASIDMLFFMTSKYPKFMKTAFLLTNYDFDKDSRISKNGQDFHTYAVIKDSYNFWYAASPANHDSNEPNSYALELIREDSLGKVIDRITKRDKGNWPNEPQIRKLLESPEYKEPRVEKEKRQIHIFEISQHNSGTKADMMKAVSDVKIE